MARKAQISKHKHIHQRQKLMAPIILNRHTDGLHLTENPEDKFSMAFICHTSKDNTDLI